MARRFALSELHFGRSVRLIIAMLAALAAVVLVLQAESTWRLSTSPWFALSIATVAAAVHAERHRS